MGFTKPLMDLKLYGDKELNTCSNTSVREQLSSRGAMKSTNLFDGAAFRIKLF